MRRIALTLILLLLPLSLFAAEPVYLSGLLIQPSHTASRFTFMLSKKTYGRVKYIPHPYRIEIEFANTIRNFEMQQTTLSASNITSMRAEEFGKRELRFIFYVRSEAHWEVKFLPDSEGDGTRLQLSILTANKRVLRTTQKKPTEKIKTSALQQSFRTDALNTFAALKTELNKPQPQVQQYESPVTIKKPQLFTVVIDAGHGGKDSGALGGNGAMEKNIVLSIAKRLAKKVNNTPHIRAVMTRNGDYFVPLRKRLALAREGKADLFVAIHADAYFDNSATGASVYALSQHGASNEAARWLAKRDNYSELGGVELSSLVDRDPILRSVLVDLAQTATIQDSIRLGNKVLDALEQISPLHYTHVERAPFVVLKSPDIPSILVETGFITNSKEERRLTDPAYQEQVANALYLGIKQYVQRYTANNE